MILNTIIVGCGKIAHRYAKLIPMISSLELVGVFDTNLEKAKLFAQENGDIPYFCDLKHIENLNIDLAIICTPNGTHYEIASFLIQSKIHILVEKPLAMNYSDAEDLLKLSESQNIRIFSMHQHRFNKNIN